MKCGPCLLVGNCLPDDRLILYLLVQSNVYDLSKGTCAFLNSNQLALYSELFQNHELMNFCEMQCQFTYFLNAFYLSYS